MKLQFFRQFVPLVLALSASVLPAGAITVTFTDKATFLAATGATDATGALPASGGPLQGPTTVGSVTFLAASPSQSFYFGDWSARFAGSEISIDAREDINVGFAGSIWSFGFDFVEPEFDPFVNDTFVNSTFTVTLFNGVNSVGAFTFNAPNDTAAFAGVWTDYAFTRAEIRETTGSFENEFFGQFYSGTQSIPDGGSGAMLLLMGISSLAALRRRTA